MRCSFLLSSAIAGVLTLSMLGCTKGDAAAEAAKGTQTVQAGVSGDGVGRTDTSASTELAATSTGDALSDSLIIAKADKSRLLGRDSGTIWVVMISDFQCPYCKQWHDESMASVQRDYINSGRVRMAYLNLPLPQHKHARAEAEAALCAGVQGKFWPYSEALFAKQREVGPLGDVQPALESVARSLSLDMTEFLRCQRRPAIRSLVESDIQQATKAGVKSTPSFLVGDFLVEGAMPYADFRKAIDTAIVVARHAKRSR